MSPYFWKQINDGVYVEMLQHCSNCKHETAVDRHECNDCARGWMASEMRDRPGWEPKGINEGD